jgi:pseudaminic acid synthase
VKIGNHKVGRHCEPFIIAEMSGNHNQSLDRALRIVEAAAKSGAKGLKLQTYTPDTMTIDLEEREFFIEDSNSLWAGNSLYKLYGEAYTPWEWHKPIFSRAKELGLTAFSTPFDESSVEFLESLDVPCYKIASFENTDLPLIRKVAATGKPLIISTGMASLAELDETVRCARESGCQDLILLKCTSNYPALENSCNILTIPNLKDIFDCEVGISDHTLGIGVSVAAVAIGATVIEKHFTLSREDGGVDSAFSMEPAEMMQLITESNRAWHSLGKINYGPTEGEKSSLQYRRSLYIVKNLKAGDLLTKENVRAIRPGLGLGTKYFDHVLGRSVKVDVPRGTPVNWGIL